MTSTALLLTLSTFWAAYVLVDAAVIPEHWRTALWQRLDRAPQPGPFLYELTSCRTCLGWWTAIVIAAAWQHVDLTTGTGWVTVAAAAAGNHLLVWAETALASGTD